MNNINGLVKNESQFKPMLKGLAIGLFVLMLVTVIWLWISMRALKGEVVKLQNDTQSIGAQVIKLSKGEVPIIKVDGKDYAVIPAMGIILDLENRIRELTKTK